MSTITKRILYTALLCGWLAFIFLNSASDAAVSQTQSDGVTGFLEALLGVRVNPNFIRKGAHFIEFFLLGLLAALAIPVFRLRPRQTLLPIALAGVFAGLADETVQLFYEGRSAQVSDVWLDYSAYLLAVLLTALFLRLLQKKRARAENTGI